MTSLVTWSGSQIGFTLKPLNNILSQTAQPINTKFHVCPRDMVFKIWSLKHHRSHGMATILDWRKILKHYFAGTSEPIEVKLSIFHLTQLLHIVWKWWHHRTCGLAAILDGKTNLIQSTQNFTHVIHYSIIGGV